MSIAGAYKDATIALLRIPTYLLLSMFAATAYTFALWSMDAIAFGPLIRYDFWQIIAGLLGLAAWYINGTGLNDYADYEIDKINLRHDKGRPLVTGSVSRQQLLAISLAAGVVAFLCSLVISSAFAIAMTVLLFLNWAYSLPPVQISHRGGAAPLLLPLGYIVLPFYMGYEIAGATIGGPHLLLIGAYYLHFISRIILKDYRDVKGDKAHGKQTFLLKHGTKQVSNVALVGFLGGTALLMLSQWDLLGDSFIHIGVIASYAATLLWQLRKNHPWKLQSPIITAYGRSLSSITIILILSAVMSIELVEANRSFIVITMITFVFLWTANSRFNI